MNDLDLRYFGLLAQKFPTVAAATTEIINLQAILNLPKGSEHFLSDIHGESEAFSHVMRNASGIIRKKIDDVFGDTLSQPEKRKLATLIYYPQEKLKYEANIQADFEAWLEESIYRMIRVAKNIVSKYTRSKVRKALNPDFQYIIEELLQERHNHFNKQKYYQEIVSTILEIDRGREFIMALSELIRRLAVDRLHIIGDIYDRGPGAEKIMDELMKHHSVDIQWGNHDMIWMGAAVGSEACMANAIRIALRYGHTNTLEVGYGINLMPLATLALDYYADEENPKFTPKNEAKNAYLGREVRLKRAMHKAITILQFKLEGQVIQRNPDFEMEDRLLLDKINFENYTVTIGDTVYPLNDGSFSTIDPENPYELSEREAETIAQLRNAFLKSEKLQRHARFLFEKGSMYLTYNSNLLLHGCVPLTKEGDFEAFTYNGETAKGKLLTFLFDKYVRQAYADKKRPNSHTGRDMMWYLWCGAKSPIFGKDQMTTFERYFVNDKLTHKEHKNAYFDLRNDEKTCRKILEEFDLDPDTAHIFNGHVPVAVVAGENPLKAGGKLLVIDGGFSKAYQSKTGIAGYTLISNSYGLQLVAHEAFESRKKAIEEEQDIHSSRTILEETGYRIRIKDTDTGVELTQQIEELKTLLNLYREGIVKEHTN